MKQVGSVKWYNHDLGYGFFIGQERDVFVHYTQLRQEHRNLLPGQQVKFLVNKGPRGLFATEVEVVG